MWWIILVILVLVVLCIGTVCWFFDKVLEAEEKNKEL